MNATPITSFDQCQTGKPYRLERAEADYALDLLFEFIVARPRQTNYVDAGQGTWGVGDNRLHVYADGTCLAEPLPDGREAAIHLMGWTPIVDGRWRLPPVDREIKAFVIVVDPSADSAEHTKADRVRQIAISEGDRETNGTLLVLTEAGHVFERQLYTGNLMPHQKRWTRVKLPSVCEVGEGA